MNFPSGGAGARPRANERPRGGRGRLRRRRVAPVVPQPRAPAPMSHAEVRKIFFGLMLAAFLAALNQTIIATALPTIGRYFGDFENLSLDRHRVSADLDGGRAALRQALRHLRPPRDDPGRDRPVRRGLGRWRRPRPT